MQIPFIVMCAGLIAIAALFAVTLWQMQTRHKRQREELENDVATLDSQVRSLRDLSSSQSSKIAEYTLTNNKLTDETFAAKQLAETRRSATVKLEKELSDLRVSLAETIKCKYKLLARVHSHLGPDGGKFSAYTLDLVFFGPSGTVVPWGKLPDDTIIVTVRKLAASKTNKKTLEDAAYEVNKTITDFIDK